MITIIITIIITIMITITTIQIIKHPETSAASLSNPSVPYWFSQAV
jgi:hypothetical protein